MFNLKVEASEMVGNIVTVSNAGSDERRLRLLVHVGIWVRPERICENAAKAK